jgi:hypothetical protein
MGANCEPYSDRSNLLSRGPHLCRQARRDEAPGRVYAYSRQHLSRQAHDAFLSRTELSFMADRAREFPNKRSGCGLLLKSG